MALLETFRIELRPKGIFVTTICPGFVKTPLTEKRKAKMPFLMELDDAARSIHKAIRNKKRLHTFPLPLAMLVKFGRLLPAAVYDWSFHLTDIEMKG